MLLSPVPNPLAVAVERPGLDAVQLAAGLAERGVRGMTMGRFLRLTTHMDVGSEDVVRLEQAAREVLSQH